jgi:hypothetical protein
MKKIIKTRKPAARHQKNPSPSVLYTFTQEYKMDPTRLKKTLAAINLESPCIQVINDIINEQLICIHKCTNAKIYMEKKIVRILKSDKFKNIALKHH